MQVTRRLKDSRVRLVTGGLVAAIFGGVWLLIAVTAAARPKAAEASRDDFHCTASAQAPSAGGQRASGRLVSHKPSALALCRYGAAPSHTLEGSRLVTRREMVHRVVRGLNALPTMPTGPVSCPSDNGSEIVVYAMYKRSTTRIVYVGLSGCLIARRGDVVRWDVPSGGHFIRVLKHLTR
jgi:hypothetical protein